MASHETNISISFQFMTTILIVRGNPLHRRSTLVNIVIFQKKLLIGLFPLLNMYKRVWIAPIVLEENKKTTMGQHPGWLDIFDDGSGNDL